MKVKIIYGRAKSGKSIYIINLLKDFLKLNQIEEVLFLLPNNLAVNKIREDIINTFNNGLIIENLFSFHTLAKNIIIESGESDREISKGIKHILLKKIISNLLKEDKLSYFKEVSEYDGFIKSLGDLIAELKLGEVFPDSFKNAIRKGRLGNKDKELLLIYNKYQEILNQFHLFDHEGRFWKAKSILLEGRWPRQKKIKFLLLDGFYNFTPIQWEILKIFGRNLKEMVISLTMEKNTRGNLFEASLETYKKIKKMFKEVEEIEVEEEKKDQILKHLHKNLFKESKIERILAENKISIFKAPSIRREVEELAKEIKKLICFEKISPNEILILFRNIDDYRDVLENVFKEYDLPLSIDWGKSILSSPLIRFILSIFEVFKEDFSREIINKLINSNYSKFKLERLPSIAKELGIIKGKSSWKQKIDQKKEILKNEILYLKNNKDNILEVERLRDYLKELEEFEKVIEELFKALDKIPSNGSFFKFIISLKQVVKDIGLKENILSSGDLDLFKEELVALNKFNESLEELLLLDSLKIFNKKISKETFYEFLKIYLEGRVYQTPSQKDFSIKIVDIHRGRTLSSRILFLGGLIEGVFPKRESSLPLYNEFERIKLNKLGLNLPLSLKYNEEKFLFYSALSIALERIYLSYSILDQEGRENLNSYFIEEVEKIFIGVKKKNFSLSEIVPPIKEIYNEKLLFNRVIFDLWRKQVQSENYERFLLSLYNHLLKNRKYKRIIYGCLLEEFRREKAEYRGILNQKIIIDKLRNRFHKDFLYSIGLLNEYAECPFRFFSKRLLNIKEIEELDIEISPLRLGNLYHKILWRLFLLLKKDKRWIDFREFEEEELISTLEEISLEIFEEFEKKGLVAKNFLWEIKKSQIKDYLRRFIKREIEEAKISKDLSFPTYFEVSFGRTSEREDNLKVFDPLVIEGIKICGKIDRIDLKFVEGEERFLVIDYKSKYIPSKKDILIGADLQLPLYILATSKLILKDVPPYQASYYSITKAKNIVRLTFKEETEIEEIISKTINHLKENVRLIKKGYYPPISKKECSTFCSYKDICRN